MKRLLPYLVSFLFVLMVTIAFVVGRASASPLAATGCFPDTNGHWAETVICWLKDNGLTTGYPDGTYKPENYVTRAEMAVLLQKTATTGEIRINEGTNSWNANGLLEPNLEIFHYDEYYRVTSSIAFNSEEFLITPNFPSALYGHTLNLKGLEYCYTANLDAYIDRFDTYRINISAGAGASSFDQIIKDLTDRTDAACLYYNITPMAVDDNTVISVFAYVKWGASGAGAHIKLGRVTFFFDSTSASAPAPKEVLIPGGPSLDGSRPIP